MARSSKTARHLALLAGLTGVACTQAPADPQGASAVAVAVADAEDSATIEGTVALDEGQLARVAALPTERGQRMFSTDVDAHGHYHLGPLPPGDYELMVVSAFGEEARVDNFPNSAVSVAANESVRSDFAQPGTGSLLVRFPDTKAPGTLVTSVIVFDGSQENISMDRMHELRLNMVGRTRSRNTISADNPTTTFDGLAPGPYTACAVVNVGGEDLHAACGVAEVTGTNPAEVSLGVGIG